MKSPPFTITPSILQRSQIISHQLGLLTGQKITHVPLKLRRSNSIKTIQASLSIEGNTLTLEQVTDLFEGKRVLAPSKDILEAKNALALYKNLNIFNPLSSKDFCKAHALLMKDLIKEEGYWRTGGVGIFKGKEVSHVAPPAKRVPELMKNLFLFLKKNTECSWLLKACIFHYELEFIHPFVDGNGRMGRLWQQLILIKENKIFEFLPIEVMIKENQEKYYEALEKSDALGESTPFIEFSLETILKALETYSQTTRPLSPDFMSRLEEAKIHFKRNFFSRKEYLILHKNISTATGSRDLLEGSEHNILIRQGNKNQTVYRFSP